MLNKVIATFFDNDRYSKRSVEAIAKHLGVSVSLAKAIMGEMFPNAQTSCGQRSGKLYFVLNDSDYGV